MTRGARPHLRLHGQTVDAVEKNCTLMREKLKVLKVMNEATGRLDLNEFAQMVELTPNQTILYMQELLKANFLKKTGGGYAITNAGRTILRAFTPVQAGMKFHFYRATEQPSSFTARNLLDFYDIIKQIAADSLEFHLYRGDFENWIRTALN